MDLLITNARLRRREGLFDLAIDQGKIVRISPMEPAAPAAVGARVIDAGGNLVTESFCNAPAPVQGLDPADDGRGCAAGLPGRRHGQGDVGHRAGGSHQGAVRRELDPPNVRRALELAVRYGNTHIRAFADVDSKAKLIGVKALLQAKREFAGLVDLQVVAFPQDGVIREPGAEALVEQAIQLGADVVGGIPWIEYTDDDARAHVRKMVGLAVKYDKLVSMLVDDAGIPPAHAGDAGHRDDPCRLAGQGARSARASDVPLPDPLLPEAPGAAEAGADRRGVRPADRAAARAGHRAARGGATVCLGQDDISDAYYPYGRNNMLEVAFLASHLLWMTAATQMESLYDMITVNAAKAMAVPGFGLAEGGSAHLVVLGVPTVLEALRAQQAPRYVISHGRLVAENHCEFKIFR